MPEQLVHYVRAVSGRKATLCEGYAAYRHEGQAVLVAYPGTAGADAWSGQAALWAAYADAKGGAPGFPPPEPERPSLAGVLAELARDCRKVTVLAPFFPLEAPEHAQVSRDCYWQLPLPAPKPGQKLRNMLARAARDVETAPEAWGDEHEALVRQYLHTRPLQPGTRAIFAALPRYASGTEGTVFLLAARRKNGDLAGFSLGDFSGLHTAFYMFSFRRGDAPPGTADLLLAGLIRHAETLGHGRMNLGLAVNGGIAFFKKKWGAEPFLPCVETSWEFSGQGRGAEGGFLGRWFGLRRDHI